jgi:ATP-dependent protease HslVU (ClpYQ) peptidase subunit
VTVIAAALTGDHVTIAADGQASNGRQKIYLDTSKLFVVENFAVGGSGDLRTIQVLKHHVTWPKYRPDEDADWEKFLVRTLVPWIRNGWGNHGIVKSDNGLEEIEAYFIVAAKDQLGILYGNGSIGIERAKRAAIGSGYAEALGRLGETGPWTEADVVDAVRRAAYSASGVGGPITVVNTGDLTIREVEAGAS